MTAETPPASSEDLIDESGDAPEQRLSVWAVLGLIGVVGLGWWLLSAPQPPNRIPVTTTTTSEPISSTTTTGGPTVTTVPGLRFAGADNRFHMSVPQLDQGTPPIPGREDQIWIGGADQVLRRLDLFNGVTATFETVGTPLIAVDGHLVVAVEAFDGREVLVIVDPDDPDRDDGATTLPVLVPLPGEAASARIGEQAGSVWVAADRGDSRDWLLVDLASGAVRRRLSTTAVRDVGPGLAGTPGPGLITSSAGGIYRSDDAGSTYSRIASGVPLAAADDLVLAWRCDGEDCGLLWLDEQGEVRTDLPRPPSVDEPATLTLTPNGDHLLVRTDAGELRVVRVADGEVVLVRHFTPPGSGVSSDGRILVTIDNGVHLFDLTTEEWAAFDLDPPVAVGRAVFVGSGIR